MNEPTVCNACGKYHLPGPCGHETDPGRRILTTEDVHDLLEQEIELGQVHLVEMGELLGNTSEACVDGRSEAEAISTPGGNAGEFLLYLDSYEKVSNKKLTEQEVVEIFDKYLNEFGKFYFHTDDHALEAMGVHDKSEVFQPTSDEQKEKLLESFTKAENIGCGHLKKAMENPQAYDVNTDLIKYLIKAFFKKFWEGSADCEFVVLGGGHAEGAVLIVKVDVEEINEKTQIPTISPKVADVSAFVYHPQAVDFMRQSSAQKVNEIVGTVTGQTVDEGEFAKTIKTSGERVLQETVDRLAKDSAGNNLPAYEVIFTAGGKVKEVVKL